MSKEFHRLSVDQIDVLQIHGNRTRFVLDYIAKTARPSTPKGLQKNYPLYVYLPTDSGRCKCNRSDFAMKYR